MSFETPITVKEAITNISKNKYFLPAIQREFVWNTSQIERLFDSLMREYPIGSFLFWYLEKENVYDYQFYHFLSTYHERDLKRNPKANVIGENDIIAILDGQQRLTALYLGLKGTYAYKTPRKRWDNNAAFPKRELYLNLLKKSDDYDFEYDFRFLTNQEANKRTENKFWFKVGNILNLQEHYEVLQFLIENDLTSLEKDIAIFANKTIFRLHKVIHTDLIINYYLEKSKELDKVLNIFIRVNSGGTQLNYSDLLLSIATAQWEYKDAREEITNFVDEINNIGEGFNFQKDFVLKSCLVLSDIKTIAFKVDNFNKHNMLNIERNWDDIADSIRLSLNLVSSYGYHRDILTSNNAIIPISYYLLKKGIPSNFVESINYREDREKIRKWLIISLLKRTFSGQPDNVLRPIRNIISNNNSSFPCEEIKDSLKGTTKSLEFNDDEIENLFLLEYGKKHIFSILALLYPTLDFKNKFHQDHIYPRSFFKRGKLEKYGITESKIEFYLDNFNYLVNIQLLEGIPNQEKSDMDFKEWLLKTYPDERARKDYMEKHYIPDVNLSFDNFEEFIFKRKKLMFNKLKQIL
ncbi:DUF262 domain-containing protein [Methanohalophilus euhalobius]|jgi:uncharacterized protein with ParB-like and HNH nuclease domain|uniref:DUF262 domain-containing protein n=1 Tax=Methanohalophilus euhalobius TaxID=51203 RepID=A0A314ZYP1_9EURY|nr:DUF262 domain-containing protein [Methanohalophilus euhalobius]PQV43197.1 uncharacterized protein DUF262 [Methanohalophilus euhalobius]RNI09247.1 DUF262 domain-containing protein [Methanohalophilus euhalobius]